MATRRTFLAQAAAAGAGQLVGSASVDASWFRRKRAGYFGVHPFIERHPEAVFIMKTDVDVKTNAKAKKHVGERFSRSVFVPMDDSGIPTTKMVAIKPNLTGHTVENDRFSREDTMGIATDPDFTEGMIDGLKDLGFSGRQIYMREVNGARVFEGRGFYDVAKRTGAELRDTRGRVGTIDENKIAQWSRAPVIDDNLLQWSDCPDGVVHRKIPHLWPINSPDAFTINLAKFKAHFMGLTLCTKNFQGAVANGYQHFCTRMQGVGNLPDEHKNPDVAGVIEENLRRHIADHVPRWDRPAMDRKDPKWVRPEHYDVECQEIWTHRALDNLSSANIGLHVIEGIYGRDGDGFLYGPNPPGAENDYEGAAWDYMTNMVIFGKNPLRVDLVGKWLGGHEPGNFGLFHIAMERGMLSLLDPMNVPVYLWDGDEVRRVPLDSFARTPLRTCYLQRNYRNMNEPVYHLVNEPFDYGAVGQESDPVPERPSSAVLTAGCPTPPNGIAAIEYAVPRDGEVVIELANASGRMVCVLERTIADAGYHMAAWDTRRYDAGIYSYTFRCGDYSETKRIELRK